MTVTNEADKTTTDMYLDLDLGKRRLYKITEEVIGKGGFSTVVKGQDLRSHSPVAIKIITDPLLAQIESTMLKSLKAPHAIRYRDDFQGSPKRDRAEQKHYIVMDLAPEKTIKEAFLDPAKPERLTVDEIISITRQLLEFLEELHKQGFGYFDLKPANLIFLRAAHSLKVIDFGGARQTGVPFTIPPHTTANYRAPERILGREMTSEFDLWSLGCTLFELLTGNRLFPIGKNIPLEDTNHYVLQMIALQLDGKPTPEFLKSCKNASTFFDEKLELRKKFKVPLMLAWEEAAEQACIKKSCTLEQTNQFIKLLSYLLCYENRPSPKELLECPLFKTLEVKDQTTKTKRDQEEGFEPSKKQSLDRAPN